MALLCCENLFWVMGNYVEEVTSTIQSTNTPKKIYTPLECGDKLLINLDYYNYKCVEKM